MENKYIDDDGSGVFPTQKVRKRYSKNIKRVIQIDIMILKMTI